MAVISKQRLWRAAALINPVLQRGGDVLRSLPVVQLYRLATVAVTVYCCHVVAGFFWFFMPLPDPVESVYMPGAEPTAALLADAQPTVDIEALKDMHLFGRLGSTKATDLPPPAVALDAEETRLDLLLLGLVVSDVEDSARAVIAHRNQQELFGVGDPLPGGAQVSLYQVLPGRVIIDNGGTYESLWLYEEDPQQRRQDQLLASRTARLPSRHVAADPPETQPVSRTPPALQPLEIEKLIAEPRTLADIIKFTPVHAEGKVLGYRVSPGRSPHVFERVGLQHNDVITSVNGVSLDDPTRALQIYRGLQGASSASFEVVRDGKAKLLDVQLEHSGNRG